MSDGLHHDNRDEEEHIYNHHHDDDGARGPGGRGAEPDYDDDDARTDRVGLRGGPRWGESLGWLQCLSQMCS